MSSLAKPWASLKGIEPVSLCDWPGRVSLVLFLGGCNLQCPTCHNSLLAWSPETLPVISREVASSLIAKRATWLDGLVVTGGEPSLCRGLVDFLLDLKSFGLPVKLDTNGLRPAVVEEVLQRGAADAIAVDVKGPWTKYPELTGKRCSALQAKTSLGAIFALAGKEPDRFIFRCTHVPGLTDTDLETVRSQLPAGHELRIQDYIEPRGASLAA